MRTSRLAAALTISVTLAAACGGALRNGTGRAGNDDPRAFSRLSGALHTGHRVRVTVDAGRVDGTLSDLRDDQLTVISDGRPRTFSCPQIARIERRGDPLWNGALIGGASAALPAWNGCQNKGRNLTCVAVGIGAWAAIGALVDRALVGTTSVYVASPGSCAIR